MEGEIQGDGRFLGSPLPLRCLLAAAEGVFGAAFHRTRRAVERAPGQQQLLQQRAEKVGGHLVRRKAAAAAAGRRRGGGRERSSGALIEATQAEEVLLPHAEQAGPSLRLLRLRRRLEEIQGLGVLRGLPGPRDGPPAKEGPAWRAGQESHQQDARGHEQRQPHVRGARCGTQVGRGRNEREKERKQELIRVALN